MTALYIIAVNFSCGHLRRKRMRPVHWRMVKVKHCQAPIVCIPSDQQWMLPADFSCRCDNISSWTRLFAGVVSVFRSDGYSISGVLKYHTFWLLLYLRLV